MFGKIKDLMEAKGKAEEVKKRLALVSINGYSENKEVEVIVTGERKVVDININQSIFNTREKSDIEQYIVQAVNNAMQQADELMAAELKAIMPNIPGMG